MPTYALSLLGREARSRMAETLPTGLRLGHLAVLGALAEHSGQSQRSLADALAIHPTDLVAIVDDLLGRRLVSRDVDPEDRRRRRVQITAAGRRLVARATAASQRVLDDILTPLTTAERETVVRLLTAALRPLEG